MTITKAEAHRKSLRAIDVLKLNKYGTWKDKEGKVHRYEDMSFVYLSNIGRVMLQYLYPKHHAFEKLNITKWAPRGWEGTRRDHQNVVREKIRLVLRELKMRSRSHEEDIILQDFKLLCSQAGFS